jgi:hypothetical protein
MALSIIFTAELPEKGFQIPNLMFTSRFRLLRWLFKHRDLRSSLPVFKRNTGMLITANLKKAKKLYKNIKKTKEIYRNTFEATVALKSVLDEKILATLPERLINPYLFSSPFIVQGTTLIPVFIAFNLVDDCTFLKWHTYYGSLRLLFIKFKPVRIFFSIAMTCNLESFLLVLDFVHFNSFVSWLHGMSGCRTRKITILMLASLAEVFGEPYSKQIPNKPVVFIVAKSSTSRFLNTVKPEPYRSLQNPMLFPSIMNDKVNFIMVEDSVPSPDCIQVSLADFDAECNRTKILEDRKQLRLKSETKARQLRDCIRRIVLF